jgi:hypothetical protein
MGSHGGAVNCQPPPRSLPSERALTAKHARTRRCPPHKAVADFLQEVTSGRDQALFWDREAAGGKPHAMISPADMSALFGQSAEGQRRAQDMAEAYQPPKETEPLVSSVIKQAP